jgi:hypothetical protein
MTTPPPGALDDFDWSPGAWRPVPDPWELSETEAALEADPELAVAIRLDMVMTIAEVDEIDPADELDAAWLAAAVAWAEDLDRGEAELPDTPRVRVRGYRFYMGDNVLVRVWCEDGVDVRPTEVWWPRSREWHECEIDLWHDAGGLSERRAQEEIGDGDLYADATPAS